ncbi:MAG: hypothetical protein PHD74_08385 [Candidatus Krumholzibacteria bacterium]|nr:hypothetical protein [Candidatus Krumholzibacteria bacterium]
METIGIVLLVIAAAALSAGIAYYARRKRSKRRAALEALAVEMRWSFSPDGDDTLASMMAGFRLFAHGHTKRFTNLMRGRGEASNMALFDYAYTIGGGKEKHTFRQTVLSLNVGGRPLPRFCLRPEHVWDKVEAFFGHKDINFDMHPEFSKKYSLRGDDEYQIQKLFTGGLIQFVEGAPGISMEGEGSTLILYRNRKLAKSEDVRAFIEMGTRLAALLPR